MSSAALTWTAPKPEHAILTIPTSKCVVVVYQTRADRIIVGSVLQGIEIEGKLLKGSFSEGK